MKQQAAQVFMVEPTHFGFNTQTALSNAFQQEIALSPSQIKEQALAEYNQFVAKLRAVGIAVYPLKTVRVSPCPTPFFPIIGSVYIAMVLSALSHVNTQPQCRTRP